MHGLARKLMKVNGADSCSRVADYLLIESAVVGALELASSCYIYRSILLSMYGRTFLSGLSVTWPEVIFGSRVGSNGATRRNGQATTQ